MNQILKQTWARAFASVFVILAVSCATVEQVNPFSSAETAEQTAFASIGVATIYLELARDLVRSPDLSDAAVEKLAVSSNAVYLAITAANQALRGLVTVKSAPDADQEKVSEAFEALVRALDQLRPAATNLLASIQTAKGEGSKE